MPTKPRVPAVDGWFTLDEDAPHLLAKRCSSCGTIVFPPRALTCPNPGCVSDDLETVELGRTGRVWSYTTNHYAPPAPYVAPDPFEPYTIAAVELDAERIVILGQVAAGVAGDSLSIGQRVEVVVETLFADVEAEHLVWRWRPAAGESA